MSDDLTALADRLVHRVFCSGVFAGVLGGSLTTFLLTWAVIG